MAESVRVPAKWMNDCQGKKDYDATLVKLSTRYWPQGGGFWLLKDGVLDENPRPEIRPSAKATIYIGDTANEYFDDAVVLAEAEFEGSTEQEVLGAVENWAREQFVKIRTILLPTSEDSDEG